MKKKYLIIAGVVAIIISVFGLIFWSLKSSDKSTLSSIEVEEQQVSNTEVQEELQTPATEVQEETSVAELVFETNPEDYIEVASNLLLEVVGTYLPNAEVEFISMEDTGVHNHIYGIKGTDIIVNVAVPPMGETVIHEPFNKFGEGLPIIYFEEEVADHMEVYNWMYDHDYAIGQVCVYYAGGRIENKETGDVYTYEPSGIEFREDGTVYYPEGMPDAGTEPIPAGTEFIEPTGTESVE